MKVLVTGSTGLVGSALVPALESAGHEVTRLVRSEPAPGQAAVRWDPGAGILDAAALEGVDAAVHLAGENIAEGRWTEAKKARIRASRVEGTGLLCRTLAGLRQKPKVLVSASAVGVYGDRGDERLDETSPPGERVRARRVPCLGSGHEPGRRGRNPRRQPRIGLVLCPGERRLAKMLPLFRLGPGRATGQRPAVR